MVGAGRLASPDWVGHVSWTGTTQVERKGNSTR